LPDQSLGVVILTFGRDNRHLQLLNQVLDEQDVAPHAVVLVHNAYDSHDKWRPETRLGVDVLATGDNLGYAGAMNLGIGYLTEADCCWFLCLTHEVRLEAGCIRELIAVGEQDTRLGVLGPALRATPWSAPWSTGVEARIGGVRHATDVPKTDRAIQRLSVDGSVMLVRRQAYEAAGPLDERMFMYWEETEFCLRVRRAGWHVGVAPRASAAATPGGRDRPLAHAYLTARNGLLYAKLVGGKRAVAVRLVAVTHDLWQATPKPFGRRFRSSQHWRAVGVRVRGTALGTADFFRGRFGAPPARVTTGSDIEAPRQAGTSRAP
jgi:GT2 family glycosyltransferase